ncbi:hypothetical protein O181_024829 [Austropuccinia psidii MF-1]|uniref:Uncharacterized protein n=1 Tax=Austropuccinia psidii MF-1 TaxID=1389203 RepID=A0A9Q3CGX4_9BASI|nr:hypothetical protein [Austropuccinia psidii MF-1]
MDTRSRLRWTTEAEQRMRWKNKNPRRQIACGRSCFLRYFSTDSSKSQVETVKFNATTHRLSKANQKTLRRVLQGQKATEKLNRRCSVLDEGEIRLKAAESDIVITKAFEATNRHPFNWAFRVLSQILWGWRPCFKAKIEIQACSSSEQCQEIYDKLHRAGPSTTVKLSSGLLGHAAGSLHIQQDRQSSHRLRPRASPSVPNGDRSYSRPAKGPFGSLQLKKGPTPPHPRVASPNMN